MHALAHLVSGVLELSFRLQGRTCLLSRLVWIFFFSSFSAEVAVSSRPYRTQPAASAGAAQVDGTSVLDAVDMQQLDDSQVRTPTESHGDDGAPADTGHNEAAAAPDGGGGGAARQADEDAVMDAS
jgi:hypothetical protein